MRVLFWFLILAGAAVAVALAARLTTGYALFVAPPYRVELSLNLLLLLVVAGFFAGYASLRIVRRATLRDEAAAPGRLSDLPLSVHERLRTPRDHLGGDR